MRDPTERLLTAPFVRVSASHFLHALALNLFLHLPGFLVGLGATEVDVGWVFAVTGATAVATRPLLGRALDTRGRRAVMVAGGVLHLVVCALYLTASTLGPWLYAIRIVHGLAEAMLFSSLFAFAADLVPASRRIEGLAVFGVSGLLPMSVGGVLGDLILSRGEHPGSPASYRDLFAAAALCAAAALILSLPLRDPPRDPDAEAPRGLAAAFVQRDLLPLWFVGLVFATALAAYFTFFKTFVLATGIGSVGLFFSAYSLSAIALRLFFGSIPERIGPKRALFPALGATAIGFALLASARTSFAVGVAGVLAGLGHGYTFPILVGLVVGRARPSERGAALALFTAVFDAGLLVGAPSLGAVIHAAGYRTMFASAAVLVIAGAAAFAAWDARR